MCVCACVCDAVVCAFMYVCVCVCVQDAVVCAFMCVCVCVRERERDKGEKGSQN